MGNEEKEKSLADDICRLMQQLSRRREELKACFIKAFLATYPSEDYDEVIRDLELVERWNRDRTEVRWFFRKREA